MKTRDTRLNENTILVWHDQLNPDMHCRITLRGIRPDGNYHGTFGWRYINPAKPGLHGTISGRFSAEETEAVASLVQASEQTVGLAEVPQARSVKGLLARGKIANPTVLFRLIPERPSEIDSLFQRVTQRLTQTIHVQNPAMLQGS